MPSKYETVCILDGFLQIGFIFHIHIKNTATLYAFGMIMIAAEMVKSVSTTGELPFSYFA